MYIELLAILTGLLAAALLMTVLVWSILFPNCRLWPPDRISDRDIVIAWSLTVTIFVASIVAGVSDWNSLDWPAVLRWGLGLPLILAGNVIVWRGAYYIGMKATSGAVAELKTDGLYRYSRNPQYVADMAILIGWGILSASLSVLPIAFAGLVALAVAPFAEEPWLKNVYGKPYEDYCKQVRRFL